MMLTMHLQTKEEPKREEAVKPIMTIGAGDGSEEKCPVVSGEKIGRNDPCPYGGGKKYKECCGREEQSTIHSSGIKQKKGLSKRASLF